MVAIDAEFSDFYFFYDASGSPIGFAFRENVLDYTSHYEFEYYWYEKNLLGDIVAIYDNSGNKVMSYSYDVWGNVTITEHGNVDEWLHLNPFTYRGYIYIEGFDMYYLGSRWYDPAVGRFISPDSVIYGANDDLLSYNLYAYCSNNPIMFTDPSGNEAISVCITTATVVLIALLCVAVAKAAVDSSITNDNSKSDAKDFSADSSYGQQKSMFTTLLLKRTIEPKKQGRYRKMSI